MAAETVFGERGDATEATKYKFVVDVDGKFVPFSTSRPLCLPLGIGLTCSCFVLLVDGVQDSGACCWAEVWSSNRPSIPR